MNNRISGRIALGLFLGVALTLIGVCCDRETLMLFGILVYALFIVALVTWGLGRI